MTYYRRHVFVCQNRRDNGDACCALAAPAAEGAIKTLRDALKQHGAHGRGKTRINRAGCFDRCKLGPVVAVYPDNVWYAYRNADDLREIAQSHLLNGQVVERLRLADDARPAQKPGGGAGESDTTKAP